VVQPSSPGRGTTTTGGASPVGTVTTTGFAIVVTPDGSGAAGSESLSGRAGWSDSRGVSPRLASWWLELPADESLEACESLSRAFSDVVERSPLRDL
jgi:hypothetical protein